MKNKDQYDEVNEDTLAALRVEEDAVRQIADRLGVKEMGPADHIRTKHEIKEYVGTGEARRAAALLKSAHQRRTTRKEAAMRIANGELRGHSP